MAALKSMEDMNNVNLPSLAPIWFSFFSVVAIL
jgi:hypothetical protein